MILTGLFCKWRTKCHIMKARIQAGLCVILDIYNTFGNDSFALLMNAGVLPRLVGDGFQKPCAHTAEADSPPQGIAEKPPSLPSASAISLHKEHHKDDLLWGKGPYPHYDPKSTKLWTLIYSVKALAFYSKRYIVTLGAMKAFMNLHFPRFHF